MTSNPSNNNASHVDEAGGCEGDISAQPAARSLAGPGDRAPPCAASTDACDEPASSARARSLPPSIGPALSEASVQQMVALAVQGLVVPSRVTVSGE
jgi:hypothetical protein